MAPARPGPEDESVLTGSISVPVLLLPGIMVHLEEDGTNNVLTAENSTSDDDNDLTSLTWLQDRNLLEEMNLRAAMGLARESPASNDIVNCTYDSTDPICGSLLPVTTLSVMTTATEKSPGSTLYDPLVHVNSKPPYSFSSLIFMAIEDSPRRALPVKDIYVWIQQHFPYFRIQCTGWKNSVRHTLSLNKGFTKVENAPNLGKGSLWVVEPRFRPNLLHSLKKASLHSFPTQELEPVVAGLVDVPSSENLLMIHSNATIPNPDLFPFLSRRLAAVNSKNRDILEEKGNATAILSLKYDSHIQACKDGQYKQLDTRSSRERIKSAKLPSILSSDQMVPVIITSACEDHTYSSRPPETVDSLLASSDTAFIKGSKTGKGSVPTLVFGKNEDTKDDSKFLSLTEVEEHRKIVEGADALLNLAGMSMDSFSYCNGIVEYPESRPTPITQSSTRGWRRGPSKPVLHHLHSLQSTKKKKSTSQRSNHKRKLQSSVTINKINKAVNRKGNTKFPKTIKLLHR